MVLYINLILNYEQQKNYLKKIDNCLKLIQIFRQNIAK